MSVSSSLVLASAALFVEAAIGYPDALYRVVGHPVTWMGALLRWLEARFNRGDARARRLKGAAGLVLLLAAFATPAWALQQALSGSLLGMAALSLLGSSLLAQRSLYDHVKAVADALDQAGLSAGRIAVSRIVGRDPAALDEAGVARAAIESLAENFSDGVVAPLFWLGLAGLAGGAAYKAANTADSMIGHRSERYRDFGWAAARFDDLVNLPASRLSALWIVLATGDPAAARRAVAAVRRDARKHRSPNAGWPEAAMAGALGLRLAGPRVYAGERVEDAYMGEGRRAAASADIRAALRLYLRACAVQFATVAAMAILAARLAL